MTVADTSLKNLMNKSNPNLIADQLRSLGIGSILRALPTQLFKKAPAADPYQLATLQGCALADDAKAHSIIRAYARVGTATCGELTVKGYATTPGSGEIAVAPNGEIVVLAADVWTSIDIVYQPMKYDIVELTMNATTADTFLLPAICTTPGVMQLLEAEATVGGVIGKKIILTQSNSKPATTKALLDLPKLNVLFAAADAVTTARLKFAIAPSIDVDALLTAASNLG